MAHRTTILGLVLKWISRSPIEALDKVHGTGRPRRGVSRWSRLVRLSSRRWLDVTPAVVVFTAGKRSDLAVACGLHLPVDSMVAMDRSSIDDQFLCSLHQEGVDFVTRQKVNAPVHVTACFSVDRSTGVTSDHDVVLTGPNGRAYPARLRQGRYWEVATGKRDGCWTNALHLSATTIAAIDQQRWPIELFLKAIKQNLRIKTFVGTST